MKGELTYVGAHTIGKHKVYDIYKCNECGTEYPVLDGKIMCNGDEIDLCPWCREDSKPWCNGRGI